MSSSPDIHRALAPTLEVLAQLERIAAEEARISHLKERFASTLQVANDPTWIPFSQIDARRDALLKASEKLQLKDSCAFIRSQVDPETGERRDYVKFVLLDEADNLIELMRLDLPCQEAIGVLEPGPLVDNLNDAPSGLAYCIELDAVQWLKTEQGNAANEAAPEKTKLDAALPRVETAAAELVPHIPAPESTRTAPTPVESAEALPPPTPETPPAKTPHPPPPPSQLEPFSKFGGRQAFMHALTRSIDDGKPLERDAILEAVKGTEFDQFPKSWTVSPEPLIAFCLATASYFSSPSNALRVILSYSAGIDRQFAEQMYDAIKDVALRRRSDRQPSLNVNYIEGYFATHTAELKRKP